MMKNKHNKCGLSRLLSTFNLGCGMSVESRDDGVFLHDEANITIISYLFQAADAGRQVVIILSDDSDSFVLLVYRTWRYDLQVRVVAQMEKCDDVVLNISATCGNLWDTVCSELFRTPALSGCDTVFYPFGKGKASVLKTLKAGNFPGLFDMLCKESATQSNLIVVRQHFFSALCGHPAGTLMTQARYNLYTRKQGEPLRNMLLPPTDTNLYLNVRRAHLQKWLWKAADQQGPPDVSTSENGWKIDDGITCPSIDIGPPGPPLLMRALAAAVERRIRLAKKAIVAVTVKMRRWRKTMTSMTMNMMMIM